MSNNIYRLGHRDASLSRSDQVEAAVQGMRDSDFAFLWLNGEFSREAMADLLIGRVWSVVAQGANAPTTDASTQLACSSTLTHVIQLANSEAQALELAPICVKHACSVPLRVYATQLESLLALSESPIEERLAVHLADQWLHSITAQQQIETESGTYRADFVVQDEDGALKLVVEADGHDFHERTKDQARRDKSRDRALLAAGYQVMRFTGSEIWADPSRCAREVRNVLSRGRQ